MSDEHSKSKDELIQELRVAKARIVELENRPCEYEGRPASESPEALGFQRFTRRSPHIAVSLDARGSITYANERLKEFSGLGNNLVKKNWFHLFVPEGIRDALYKAHAAVFTAEYAGEFSLHENAIVSPGDGRRLEVSWFNTRRCDEHGRPVEVDCLGVDVTRRKKAESKLQERKDQYRALFENNQAVMMLIDPGTGAIVEANKAAVRFYGYSKERLKTMHIQEINILPPEKIEAEMAKAQAEKRSHFYFTHKLANGDVRDVEVHSGPISVRGKTLLCSVVHDFTERRQSENALLESEEKYRCIFEAAQDCMVIANEHGVVVDVNPSTCRTYGYDRDEMLGLPATTLITPKYWPVFSEFRKQVQEYGSFFGETVDRRKDGTMFHTDVRGAPLTIQGRPHMLAVVRDVTERIRLEEALRRGEQRLALALKSGGAGVWEWDVQRERLLWDEQICALFRVDPKDFKGEYEDWRGRLHPEDVAPAEEALRQAFDADGRFDCEFRIVWPDGSIRHIMGAGLTEYDENGAPVRMIGVNWDVTEERRIAQLQQDVERITRHDIKSPLMGVLGLPQTMMGDENLTEQQKLYLQCIISSGRRILNLVNFSMVLFQIEQGRYECEAVEFNVLESIQTAIADLESLISAKQMTVRLVYSGFAEQAPDVAPIRGEKLLAYSILCNLLKNALEASPEKQTVHIAIENGAELGIVIQNQGMVSPAMRERFFEKYATEGKKDGTGLGTYSAKLMAEVQGWRLEMFSSEEEGTSLTLKIPREQD